MTEQFYRDISALTNIAVACAEERRQNLTGWVCEQLQPRVGDSILNIGCRNSKLALALTGIVGETGYVLALDRSYRVLNALSQESQEQGLERRIRFLHLDPDDLHGHLRRDDFDRALSTRALTRSKHPQAVFQAIYQALKFGGVFFCYGPSRKDLAELRLFTTALTRETSASENRELLFMEKVGLPYASEIFSEVEAVTFEHALHLDAPELLCACWRESAFYAEELENDFRRAAVHHFQSHASFETAQRLVGIRARKS